MMSEEESNHSFCKKIKDLDAFGRDITLYYKGKEKSKTYFGSVFTILYSSLYFSFLVYKIVRMLKRTDVTFYDSQISPEKRPSIQLNKDNFYGGFSLEDPNTYDPFMDETIYTVKAFFKRAERSGGLWNWYVEELELEKCQLEKFGDLYKEEFSKKPFNSYYCFKNMDYVLEGTFNYDAYSMFYVQFFPCMNTTENNNHCKSLGEIDYYLEGTFLSLQMEDIQLTPENFDKPTRPTAQDIYTTVGKKLFKEFHVYYRIVNVETDLDIFGLDEIENKKTEKFLQFDSSNQMTTLKSTDIYKTGESFTDITIKLSDFVFTQKRTYLKLLDILGDVGGIMEVILAIFELISSFSTDLLFETSLVNSLFEFDLDSNQVFIHNKYREKRIRERSLREGNITAFEQFPTSQKNLSNNPQNFTNDNLKDPSTKRQMNPQKHSSSITVAGEEDLIRRRKRRRKNNIFGLKVYMRHRQNKEANEKNNVFQEEENKIPTVNYENIETLPQNINNNLENKDIIKKAKSEISFGSKKKINSTYKGKEKIDKIQLGKFWIYVFFICAKKRKTTHTILLEEAMNIISENLDIINVFKKIYGQSKNEKLEVIQLSESCKKELDTLTL